MTTSQRTSMGAVALLALAGGVLLVVDCVTITVLNRSFGALDNILFLAGFVLMLVTGVALAVHLSAGMSGLSRLGRGGAAFVGFAAVLGAISWVADSIGRHVFSSSNVGLHGEWSFFSIGVVLLLLAGWASRRRGSGIDRVTPAGPPSAAARGR